MQISTQYGIKKPQIMTTSIIVLLEEDLEEIQEYFSGNYSVSVTDGQWTFVDQIWPFPNITYSTDDHITVVGVADTGSGGQPRITGNYGETIPGDQQPVASPFSIYAVEDPA